MWDAASNNRAFVWGQASIIQNADLGHPEHGEEQPGARQEGGARAARRRARPRGWRRRTCSTATCSGSSRTRSSWPSASWSTWWRRPTTGSARASSTTCRAFPGRCPTSPRKLGCRQGRPGPEGRARAARRPLRAPRRGRPLERLPGHPGHVTPAIDETLQRGVIPAMFARAARGDQSPEVVRARRRGGDAPHLRSLAAGRTTCWRRPSRAASPSRRGWPRRRRCGRRGGSRRRRSSRGSGTRCSSRCATRSRPGSTW